MNYIREAEQVLWYYRDLHDSIERMDRQIAKLIGKAGPKNISAMVTDEEKLGDGHHDEIINILFEIQQLSENRANTEAELLKVDCLLEGITKQADCENYAMVLKAWYVEKKDRHEIARELSFSERHMYRIKNKAIRKFAVRLFGIEAMKVV